MHESVYDPPQSSQPTTDRRPGGFRGKLGLILLTVGVAGTIIANRIAANDTDRIIRIYQGGGVTLVTLLVWWLFFSGISIWVRVIWLTVVGAGLAGGSILSIRKIEFTGDMRPHFWFVWDPPSPSEEAQKWLSRNAPTSANLNSPDASETSGITARNAPQKLTITSDDWPRYCGLNGSREVNETPCSFDWSNNPPRELWRRPVGDAWSSFTIVSNYLFTQEQRGPLECVVCYDADSGNERWRHEDTARYETPQGGIGPRATPAVTETAVFTLGATGILNALNPLTGAKLWQRNVCDDASSSMLEWGMSGSPIVYENTVIVDAGGNNDKAVMAYDQASGDIVWAAGNHQAGYATPRLETIGGTLQLLVFHGEGLQGLDPSSGKQFWEYPWTNQYKINVAQPMLFGNSLFLSSGYDSGCVLIDPTQLQDGRPAEVWPPNKSMKLKFNEAVQRGDYVYGLDDGILACIDSRNGKRTWKNGRYRHGQVLLWGDKLIVQAEPGFVAVVEASPTEFKEVARLEALNDRTWNMLMINRNRLYTRNASEAVCYELPSHSPIGGQ